MKLLKFYKEKDNRWFVDLPEWKGNKDDLEMVMGADTMLDYISEGENEVFLYISTNDKKNHKFKDDFKYELTFVREDYDGAFYNLIGQNIEMVIWLCAVTKFIFNEYPNKIYIK